MAVTVALEMTAPDASVTVPVIFALMSWPKAAEHTKEAEQDYLECVLSLEGLHDFLCLTLLNIPKPDSPDVLYFCFRHCPIGVRLHCGSS